MGPEQVVVVDRLVDAIKIVQDFNGMRLNAWLNRRGEVMRQRAWLWIGCGARDGAASPPS